MTDVQTDPTAPPLPPEGALQGPQEGGETPESGPKPGAVIYAASTVAEAYGDLMHEHPEEVMALAPPEAHTGIAGTFYAILFAARTPAHPVQFSLAGGTLPPGLTIAPGGLLSGVPEDLGAFSFTLQAHDANGVCFSSAYGIEIVERQPDEPEVAAPVAA